MKYHISYLLAIVFLSKYCYAFVITLAIPFVNLQMTYGHFVGVRCKHFPFWNGPIWEFGSVYISGCWSSIIQIKIHFKDTRELSILGNIV